MLGSFVKKYFYSDFIKNVLVLITGTSIAQVIPIALSPVLTRLYTPEQFGLWGLYMAIAGLFAVIANGRYELAIMLPKNEADGLSILKGSIYIALCLTIVIGVLVAFLNEEIAKIIGNIDLKQFLFFIPLSILVVSIYQGISYWFNRKKAYKVLSISRVVQTVSTGSFNLLFGLIQFSKGGLIIGTFLGQCCIALYMLVKSEILTSKIKTPFSKIKNNFIEYKDFPLKSSVGILLNILSEQIPVFLISILFGNLILGYYTLVIKVFSLPMSVIAGSFSQVFYQKAIELEDDLQELRNLVKQTTVKLFAIVVPPMLILAVFSSYIFSFIFGSDWIEASVICKYFTFYYVFRFVFSSQSTLIMVLRKLGFEVRINLVNCFLQLLAVCVGWYMKSYIIAFMLMSFFGGCVFITLGLFLFKFTYENDRK